MKLLLICLLTYLHVLYAEMSIGTPKQRVQPRTVVLSISAKVDHSEKA